jgi:UDP-GlcNAc:undecaprenyl-phosphate GlcNAc-1-phosphate transferase
VAGPVTLAWFAALTVVAAHLGTRLWIGLAGRLGASDMPAAGKIHTRPVPTAGGLPVVLAFLGGLWATHVAGEAALTTERLAGLTVAAVLVLALGVYDDLRGTSAWEKLLAEAAASVVLFVAGFRVVSLTNPLGDAIPLGWLALPVTVGWILVVTNAVNVIDGLDGLAAGVVAIAALTLFGIALRFEEATIAVLALLLAAATLGFLPLNWPPARVFLGDAGSLSLGFLMGATSLLENRKGTVAVTLLLPIVLLAIPLLDAALAFARRVRRGRHPFRRDTEHLHHRLLALGLAPRQILTFVYGVAVCLGLTAFLISVMPKQFVAVLVLILGIGGLVALRMLAYLERAAERARRTGGSA